ncbi:MAG: phosphoribosylanthranilate isomerase [Pseudomonadota bacterium]
MTQPETTHVWCKICGITSPGDARHANAAGADAIGINFYPASTRFVSLDAARAIAAAVDCTRVALFVDASEADVGAVVDAGVADMLQFQGDEPPEFCRGFGLPYIKAHRVMPGRDINAALAPYADAEAWMLDAYLEGVPGGTGHVFDWSLWPAHGERPLVLAGGLNPHNIVAAIDTTKPWGVDVCGGLEASKGVKDPDLVSQFMQEVRRVSEHQR